MPEKPEEVTEEMTAAVEKTLYHHPRSSPIIVQLLIGKTFNTPPSVPSEEEKAMAHEVVEELIALHYRSLRLAFIEVLGEDLETDWM